MRKIYNYGQIIRAKRQNKNIKAINLAKDLGITPAYLSLIESNQRKPDGDLLLRIQDLLELQKEDLTKRTDPDLESRTQEIVKISLLEDLDIRSDEVQEIVRLNPKIAMYNPQAPGIRPDGIGLLGSLMASTSRSNQSFKA